MVEIAREMVSLIAVCGGGGCLRRRGGIKGKHSISGIGCDVTMDYGCISYGVRSSEEAVRRCTHEIAEAAVGGPKCCMSTWILRVGCLVTDYS